MCGKGADAFSAKYDLQKGETLIFRTHVKSENRNKITEEQYKFNRMAVVKA